MNILIDSYRKTIMSVESQSCDCGGILLQGGEWRQRGCGISYEYRNDISVRSAIESTMVAQPLSAEHYQRVVELDNRLKTLLAAYNVSILGTYFWENGLPFGVSE
jgi:hypothetical protein